MPPAEPEAFVMLATLADPAAAELCAALLRSEGIDSRLRGESLGPYRLTIGAMAATQVWVPVSRLDDARSLVLQGSLGEIELARDEDRSPVSAAAGPGVVALLLGAVVVGLALWLLLSQLL